MHKQNTAKSALVTGGGKRVGRVIALTLASHGYDIALHYHQSAQEAEQTAKEIEQLGRRAATFKSDMTEPENMTHLMADVTKVFGPVSTLIHNASYFVKDHLGDVNQDSWEKHHLVNLQSPIMLTKAFVEQFREEKQMNGNIICLLDGMVGWSISPHFLSYSLSKLGLENSITLLAADLAPHIRVNGIALGATLPGVMDKPNTFQKIANMVPLRRNSNPQEVADTVMFLLTSESITGHIIDLSNGMSL